MACRSGIVQFLTINTSGNDFVFLVTKGNMNGLPEGGWPGGRPALCEAGRMSGAAGRRHL